ncbi:MAG: DUF1461 domain-containing protein [Coriobacteriales bacterium]|jgi:uncharacterized membrane protein|nr:DUF1461 domain-containing protein [Coriobacteriales bacterium]
MRVLGAVLVALWLLLASFMLVLSPPVTHILAEKNVDLRGTQLTRDYLVSVADDTRAYCAGFVVALPLGSDERVAFTPEVMAHLDDVRAVFVACEWAALALSVGLAVYLAVAWRLYPSAIRTLSEDGVVQKRTGKKQWRSAANGDQRAPGAAKNPLTQALVIGALTPLVLAVCLAVVGFLNFEALFSAMHRIFFAEGSWLFAADSLLIRALPEGFWIGCALVWALSLLLLCLIVLAVAFRRGSARHSPKGSATARSR